MNILFRFDGNNIKGLGHVFRSIHLIDNIIQRNEGHKCICIISHNEEVESLLKNKKIDYYVLKNQQASEILEVNDVVREQKIDTIVLDKLDNECDYVTSLCEQKINVVILDDHGSYEEMPVKVINAIIDLTTDKKNSENYVTGVPYMVLNDQVTAMAAKEKEINPTLKNVLLTFGGSDPRNFSEEVVEQLHSLEAIQFDVVLGPAYAHKEHLYEKFGQLKNIDIHTAVDDLPQRMYQADLCFCSGGITLFESLAIGVPTVVLCQVPHQYQTAQTLSEKGLCWNLGLEPIKDYNLVELLHKLEADGEAREALSKNGKTFVDCKGVKRVTDIILGVE